MFHKSKGDVDVVVKHLIFYGFIFLLDPIAEDNLYSLTPGFNDAFSKIEADLVVDYLTQGVSAPPDDEGQKGPAWQHDGAARGCGVKTDAGSGRKPLQLPIRDEKRSAAASANPSQGSLARRGTSHGASDEDHMGSGRGSRASPRGSSV